ncbi:uncharacterized protein Bfra_005730 [Botrytis fragariae]|uniref:Uncharacterized protein n=1 Tax=Botrytis fragariae TaxID=1964551 RepID=A0A8H6EHH9_9HELO|nr:uncharacterized protein Bfra_005730 [Botrytis fragariae]KAF5872371.1 hypothetical protein Bfra_005730 [Botrytis fragariae]
MSEGQYPTYLNRIRFGSDWGADVVFGGKLTFADGSRTLLLAEILDILDILQYYICHGVVVKR